MHEQSGLVELLLHAWIQSIGKRMVHTNRVHAMDVLNSEGDYSSREMVGRNEIAVEIRSGPNICILFAIDSFEERQNTKNQMRPVNNTRVGHIWNHSLYTALGGKIPRSSLKE